MALSHVAPLLFSLLVGLLLGVSAGSLPARLRKSGYLAAGGGEDLLLVLAMLAAFGLGGFLTYVFLY